jgi:hypothetical protein
MRARWSAPLALVALLMLPAGRPATAADPAVAERSEQAAARAEAAAARAEAAAGRTEAAATKLEKVMDALDKELSRREAHRHPVR